MLCATAALGHAHPFATLPSWARAREAHKHIRPTTITGFRMTPPPEVNTIVALAPNARHYTPSEGFQCTIFPGALGISQKRQKLCTNLPAWAQRNPGFPSGTVLRDDKS